MKLRRETRSLKLKALASLRRGVTAFNGPDDEGRQTAVLLHLQHAAEMLLKAVLVHKGVRVFDEQKKTSIGFKKALALGQQHCPLSDGQAGLLRAFDALRDAEQHWMVVVSEDFLFLHARGLVTTFDEVLRSTLGDSLADHLPLRVLPLSTIPPKRLDLLIDREFTQIKELLEPGRRRREEARGRIRALLAMESHAVDAVDMSEADIDRIEKGVRRGDGVGAVFPRLSDVAVNVGGEGLAIQVRFSKTADMPVRFVAADDPIEAAAVREIDLRNRFRYSKMELASKVGVSVNHCAMLRRHLGVELDPACVHVFTFGKSKHPQYSEIAVRRLRTGMVGVDLGVMWIEHLREMKRRRTS